MGQSRYDYCLCETTTLTLPEQVAGATGKGWVMVLCHPDAPFDIQELSDDVLPALGLRHQEDVAYLQTPVPLSLELARREHGAIAVLTFHRALPDVTLVHLKWLKKVIGSLATKLPCEVTFAARSA